MQIELQQTKRTDVRLLARMAIHYSKPRGFVGRNICYAVLYDGQYYGHIVAGSATRFLPGRDTYFGFQCKEKLNSLVNNVFFNIAKVGNRCPIRNFSTAVLLKFMQLVCIDWESKYGDKVLGFKTLIELPRTGELYRRAGFVQTGVTKGFTCKREAGTGTDSWTGKRVWNTVDLRPKLVLCRHP